MYTRTRIHTFMPIPTHPHICIPTLTFSHICIPIQAGAPLSLTARLGSLEANACELASRIACKADEGVVREAERRLAALGRQVRVGGGGKWGFARGHVFHLLQSLPCAKGKGAEHS